MVDETAIVAYLAFNGVLQLIFIKWVFWRNKSLTLLLVEHYQSIK